MPTVTLSRVFLLAAVILFCFAAAGTAAFGGVLLVPAGLALVAAAGLV